MFITSVQEYINILKIRGIGPVGKDIYSAQILNNAKGEKFVILRELLPSSEHDTQLLIITSELLATKIYDMYFIRKNVDPTEINWIEIYHPKSFRGKKCRKKYINTIKYQWDSKSEKYCKPEWKALSWNDFSKIIDEYS